MFKEYFEKDKNERPWIYIKELREQFMQPSSSRNIANQIKPNDKLLNELKEKYKEKGK